MTTTTPTLPPDDWPIDDDLFDDWLAAWAHVGEVRGWLGRDGIHPYREVTTGSELCRCTSEFSADRYGCRYHFPTGRCRCVWDVTHPTQHHRIPNRSCPAHWQPPEPEPPAVPLCSCEYVIHLACVPLVNHPRARVRSSRFVVATGFTIDPWCPHHGAEPRWTPTDRPWETTLGPDETT